MPASSRRGGGPAESARRGGIPAGGPRCPDRLITPIDDPVFSWVIDWFHSNPGPWPWRRHTIERMMPDLPKGVPHRRMRNRVIWLARMEVLWIDRPDTHIDGQVCSEPWMVWMQDGWTPDTWIERRDERREWLRFEQGCEKRGHPDELAKLQRPVKRGLTSKQYRDVLADADRLRAGMTAREAGWMPPATYGTGRHKEIRAAWRTNPP